jgi:hypothetical protein
MLSGGGEKMEEVARVLIDVGDSLDGARKATAGQVQSLSADITETINRRNAYTADNAAVLTPEAVAAADQRLLQQTVDAVRSPVIELRPARVRPDRGSADVPSEGPPRTYERTVGARSGRAVAMVGTGGMPLLHEVVGRGKCAASSDRERRPSLA